MVICCGFGGNCVSYDFTLLRLGVKKKTLIILFFILLAFSSLELEAQCAMCRAVLESEEGQSTAEGVNNGIVYLMAIPYLVVAGIGYAIYRKFRN